MARRSSVSHRDALRSRRRRQARRARTYAPRGEALEQRLVLSLSAAADSTSLKKTSDPIFADLSAGHDH